MKQYKAILYLVAFLLLVASCGGPSNDEVKKEFLKDQPNAVILSIGPGEGDSGNVYMHIRYRHPGSNKEMEDVWPYQVLGGKKLENTWKKSAEDQKDSK